MALLSFLDTNLRVDEGSVAFCERFYILGGYQRTDNLMVMRLLNSIGRCCPFSDEWQLLPPMLQPRMSPRGVVAIGRCRCDSYDHSALH